MLPSIFISAPPRPGRLLSLVASALASALALAPAPGHAADDVDSLRLLNRREFRLLSEDLG